MELKLVGSIVLLVFTILALKLLDFVWFKPKKLEKLLRKQGFGGNPYRILIGDMKEFIAIFKAEQPRSIHLSHDIAPHMLPYYHRIIDKYGKGSYIWFGPTPTLNITDPELLKEILANPGVFQKPRPSPVGETITGGLLFLEGDEWTKRRKTINPAFHMEKLKDMAGAMYLSCSNMVEKWESLLSGHENSREIDVWPYIVDLSGDMISRTAFGSSHEEGRKIFELQKEQVKLAMDLLLLFFVPGWRFLPTKANRRMKATAKEIQTLLRGIISQRERAREREETVNHDLLGILMESNSKEVGQDGKNGVGLSTEDIIEECKLFYFAGSETTSNLLVWTMVLLSKHQDWQDRAREEVLQVLGRNRPTLDGLNHLKTVTMILHEALRLYAPVPLILRGPKKTVKLGSYIIPKGVNLTLLLGLLHHDTDVWGDDAKEFNPQRFSGGVSSAAKTQFAFMPFSSGPRVCIGQNFAMMEAKMALTMILQRFSFDLSPSYKHAPFVVLTLQPQQGVPLILHKL